MAFEVKTWNDRITEYPNRRILTDTSTNESQTVLVERSEGAISNEGDAFSAENMNDLEQRIADTFGGFGFYPAMLTQAEYDALPEETKQAEGMLFVIRKE